MEPFWVLTFNIAGQLRNRWRERSQHVAKVFEKSPCSLAGFQEFGAEADSWSALGHARKGMGIYRGEQIDDIWVNPIVWDDIRFKALDQGTFWLSENGEQERSWDAFGVRAASWVRFHTRFGKKEFLHLNVHLDNVGRIAREKSMGMIIDFINRPENINLPVILTGDLNLSTPYSGLHRWKDPEHRLWSDSSMYKPYEMMDEAGLKDCWAEAHLNKYYLSPERPCTFHNGHGPKMYMKMGGDGYGLYDPDEIRVRGFKVINCNVVDDHWGGMWPSDHLGLVALVEL